MSGRRHAPVDFVEPDLPIVPMLDMSFQLLAFFIITFRPAPTEGQIAMQLPPPELGGGPSMPGVSEDKPVKYIVTVVPTDTGTIGNMKIREDGAATDPKDLGADVKAYFDELKRLSAALKDKPGKLTLEIGGKLVQAYVVQLLDHGVRAGFNDISPVPIDSDKR
jgi:biopolymer transport protein ExbD